MPIDPHLARTGSGQRPPLRASSAELLNRSLQPQRNRRARIPWFPEITMRGPFQPGILVATKRVVPSTRDTGSPLERVQSRSRRELEPIECAAAVSRKSRINDQQPFRRHFARSAQRTPGLSCDFPLTAGKVQCWLSRLRIVDLSATFLFDEFFNAVGTATSFAAFLSVPRNHNLFAATGALYHFRKAWLFANASWKFTRSDCCHVVTVAQTNLRGESRYDCPQRSHRQRCLCFQSAFIALTPSTTNAQPVGRVARQSRF